jgi:hypothetical protein
MVLDEPANGNNNLHPPVFGHVFERNDLPVEYARWVRIVGT